jgi:NADH-quinone oxidoreductase subunit G/NADP-reducing hydrogenase subunit HndD
MKNIRIKINGQSVSCRPDESVRQAALRHDIDIPGLCDHPDFPPKANCRLCIAEVRRKGESGSKAHIQTTCTLKPEEGMEVMTETEKIKKIRNINIELLFAEHIEKCGNCVWRFECKLLGFAEKYKILITRFPERKKNRKTYKFANAVEIDNSQCIDCRNCLDACSMLQNIDYLELRGKGVDQEVVPTKDKTRHCILCGQCALHCPVSAAQEQTHYEMVEKALKKSDKIVIAQFAPSIRVSIGEDFGIPHGSVVTEQIVTGLKELGFDYVFDVNFGADVTTIVEARELLERIQDGGIMPMITSCCPGWVNYAEWYHPELLPNITTSRSPHIHNGGIIKTYWAKQMGVDPSRIVVVSVMPCTAKKYEAARKEMKLGNNFPVDYVITTREFSFLLKKNQIDFANLKKTKADNPLGEYSGAAAIFGGSGGVMESALRTAHHFACSGKKNTACRPKIEFKEVRGMDGVKESVVSVGGSKLRVAVVNGIGNVESVIENLDKYDYIEVMACPGGCIGGGGQPIPTTPEIRQKRINALYKHDKNKKVRSSFENQQAIDVIDWLDANKQTNSVLYTKYKKRYRY